MPKEALNLSLVAISMHERINELDFVPEEEDTKKVTSRLPVSVVDKLDEVAGRLAMTRTMCAERLLAVSIEEAYSVILTDPVFVQRGPRIPADTIKAIEEDDELRAAVGAKPSEVYA